MLEPQAWGFAGLELLTEGAVGALSPSPRSPSVSVVSTGLLCGVSHCPHVLSLTIKFDFYPFRCPVPDLGLTINTCHSAKYILQLHLVVIVWSVSVPINVIYSYIAVRQMERQRRPQLMSIPSKYPSLPAVHGGGAALPPY